MNDLSMHDISIILFEPEIPPNTGNIIRLCANSGANLHLIEPLGFTFEDKALRRAGLDYQEWAEVKIWASFAQFLEESGVKRTFAMTTKGSKNFYHARFQAGDGLIFGPESRGLPQEVLMHHDEEARLRLPMSERGGGRSLNLSNSAAIGLYEIWRQLEFS